MKYLVTGAAGFIGFHLVKQLIESNNLVVGIDNINAYYDVGLKKNRVNILEKSKFSKHFNFIKLDICDNNKLKEVFLDNNIDCVIHLAAQAGVRYSIENPQTYIDSNIQGFINILENCRHSKIKHLIYASSSSVYGNMKKQPLSINSDTNHPISLYAATKKSNELMAYTYSHLFSLFITGLRFFTVYGPYGRPDMAYFKFTKSILEGEPIDVFNNGEMYRDFTYIDDVVDGLIQASKEVPQHTLKEKHKVLNVGNNMPINLEEFISVIEECVGKKALKKYLPMQQGDVKKTFADIEETTRQIGFKPITPITVGIPRFVEWYKNYYNIT